jgi:hypothetical protein
LGAMIVVCVVLDSVTPSFVCCGTRNIMAASLSGLLVHETGEHHNNLSSRRKIIPVPCRRTGRASTLMVHGACDGVFFTWKLVALWRGGTLDSSSAATCDGGSCHVVALFPIPAKGRQHQSDPWHL